METLQLRLKNLENATGSEIWQVLKESEPELLHDLASLRQLQREKEKNAVENLEKLKTKRKELHSVKNEVNSLKKEYGQFLEDVEAEFQKNGLEIEKVVGVFERVIAEDLQNQKSEVLKAISTAKSSKSIEEPLEKIEKLLETNKDLKLEISEDLTDFFAFCEQIIRQKLWNLFKIHKIPMKIDNSQEFIDSLEKIRKLCGKIDKNLLIATSFGYLQNLSIDMVKNEKGAADFEWILTSFHKWAKNLLEILGLEENDNSDQFCHVLNSITREFLVKNENDPLVFSKLAGLFRKFENNCEFDLDGQDLMVPFYEPQFISKWILLEVEMFTLSSTQLFSSPTCFHPLSAISIGASATNWASEVTIFFEDFFSRIDKDIRTLQNPQVQHAFYETLQILMLDTCEKIRQAANVLYGQATWSNDVYLVMNTTWELRRLVGSLGVSWPVSNFEVERAFEQEWKRLGDMISEYLADILESPSDKTFYHIVKCLRNVHKKSKGPLLPILAVQVLEGLQKKVTPSSEFYNNVYNLLFPQLVHLLPDDPPTRSAMCTLDAILKSSASRDPSGELVRIAFRSIDEEQVVKMLAELGIYSTSDHAFQDYQILAENWDKIRG